MKISILVLFIFWGTFSYSQNDFILKIELKEPIVGVCDMNNFYILTNSYQGQKEAKPAQTKAEILDSLKVYTSFLKQNPKYKNQITITMIINCKGEVISCKYSEKKKSTELENSFLKVFNSLTNWEAGQLNGKNVDSEIRFGFEINKGILIFIY